MPSRSRSLPVLAADKHGRVMERPSVFDFTTFPVLTTQRLILRAFVPQDAADLYAFRSDTYAQRYNDPPLTDLSQAHALIQWMIEGFAAQKMIQWARSEEHTS